MFKKALSLALVCSITLRTIAVHADTEIPSPHTPVAGELDVGAAVSPMKKGQIAPFTGVLLSPKAVATIIAELDAVPQKVKIEVDKARGEEKAQCDFKVNEVKANAASDKKVADAKLEENAKRLKALEDQIKKEENSRPNLGVWVGVGFVGGVIVTAATSYIIVKATK